MLLNKNYIYSFSVILISIFYSVFTFNSYFPITEGWFSAYANLVLNGQLPYKDFILLMTPGYVYLVAFIQYVFGDSIFILRSFGIFINSGIAYVLFKILRIFFSNTSAMVGATLGFLYYQSGVAFINYDFTQVLTLLILVLMLLLLKIINCNIIKTTCVYMLGVLSPLPFLIKQSNGGVFSFLFVLITIISIALRVQDERRARFVSYYVFGVATTSVLFTMFLVRFGIFYEFIDQVFMSALEAKGGSLIAILSGWIGRHSFNSLSLWFNGILVFLVPIIAIKQLASNHIKLHFVPDFVVSLFCIISTFVALICAYKTFDLKFISKPSYFDYVQNEIFILSGLIVLIKIIGAIKARKKFNPNVVLFAFLLISLIFSNGTSGGISEISLFVPLSFIVAFCVTNLTVISALILIPIVFVFVFNISRAKFDSPYHWWGVSVPSVREIKRESSIDKLRGIKSPVSTVDQVDNVVNTILSLRRSTDDIFVYPNISGLYYLADFYPKSKVIVPWFDFLSNKYATEEAKRIVLRPPDILVYLELPSNVIDIHENLFRSDKRIGQREIERAINDNVYVFNLYRKIKSVEITNGVNISIWQKK